LNAAFSLRGLTSGALLGSLILALFWRRVGPRAAMTGMIVSFVVMNVIYWPANVPAWQVWWKTHFGEPIYWPWFTLIGTLITLSIAWAAHALWPESNQKPLMPPVN